MAVRELNPGNTEPLLGESVSDRIQEFVFTDYGKVVQVVALHTGAEEEAEDAVQAALLRILARDGQPPHLDLHVAVLASDLISSRRRKAAGILGRIQKVFGIGRADSTSSGGALRRTLSELPRRQRMVSLLHYYLGYPVSEISPVLGLPQVVVEARLRLARLKLRALLD